MKIHLERVGEALQFQAVNEAGYAVDVGAALDHGGTGAGARPMQLLVMGLGGCSAIDILTILEKGRQHVTSFSVELDAERDPENVPSLFTRIHAHYHFTGALTTEAVRRAIELSLRKYCSVARILERTAEIAYAFTINGERHV